MHKTLNRQAGELHLYVHIPFCVHKCAYCDFNSHVRQAPPWEHYRLALLAELDHWSDQGQFAGRKLTTVFFGGGTPSLAPATLIADVLQLAAQRFELAGDAEITLEANPGTVDTARFAAYREAGINRLSIGVQSFDDAELLWLERIHNGSQAMQAFERARNAGFDNISLDLMHGLPGQSMHGWLESLNAAIGLSPKHLSCYQLTIEAHTELAQRHRRQPLALPEDELALDFLRSTRSRLSDAGYQAYEVSNFSRPGRYCRHNDAYWLYHDYIGIGAGAAGKWDEDDGGITRYADIRSPEGYIKAGISDGRCINNSETLGLKKAAGEAVWLGLRRHDGIDQQLFSKRFGQKIGEMFGEALRPWQRSGHLLISEETIKLSDKGLGMADSIAVSVLTD